LVGGTPELKELIKRLKVKPYRKAIERLRMLNEEEGPMKKIKLLDDVGTLILECIDDLHSENQRR